MSLLDKLSQAKSTLDNLLAFANNKTGKGDTSIGDAIKTLVDGYGGGSGGTPFEWGGMNATLVSEYNEDYTLEDTSFDKDVTYGSTATTLLASVSNKYTNTTGSPTYAYGDKDIVVVQTINCEIEHEEGASNAGKMLKNSYVMVSWFSKRKTSDTSAKTTRQVYSTNTGYVAMKYYNASGVLSRVCGTAYGFYGTPQVPSVASATTNSTYVRASSPSFACRTHSTYESAANMKLVKDVTWHWNVKVYAVDSGSSITNAVNDVHDAWLTD